MEDLKHFFLMICRDQTEQFFEWLLQYRNIIDVNYQITEDDIKEIICELQGEEFESKDNTDTPGLVFNQTFETKMTLLLLALSLERISMAEILLELCEDDIAVDNENSFGISAVHMLLMISFGDERYDELGKANKLAAPQVDLEDKIKKLIQKMIEKGHPKVDKSHNIIANAILHNHIDVAEELIKAGFPYPENNNDIGDIELYLINNSNSENALSRIIRIREIFSIDHHHSSNSFFS